MKQRIICPVCGNVASLEYVCEHASYLCKKCGWDSDIDTLDISYSNNATAPLSNFFPHEFVLDGVKCKSMESFIQSLREKDSILQKNICSNYSGLMAHKLKQSLTDWRKTGFVYWKGEQIIRKSDEYTNLITRAYDALYHQNIVFSEILNRSKDKILIHSIGCDVENETLLTEAEFRYQLNRLRNMS